jgi:hypothetical protein
VSTRRAQSGVAVIHSLATVVIVMAVDFFKTGTSLLSWLVQYIMYRVHVRHFLRAILRYGPLALSYPSCRISTKRNRRWEWCRCHTLTLLFTLNHTTYHYKIAGTHQLAISWFIFVVTEAKAQFFEDVEYKPHQICRFCCSKAQSVHSLATPSATIGSMHVPSYSFHGRA